MTSAGDPVRVETASEDGTIGPWSPGRSRTPRSWSTSGPSGTTARVLRELVAPAAADGGGEGGRLRPRHGARARRRRPRRRRAAGSAWPPWTRRLLLREHGDTGRILAWLDRARAGELRRMPSRRDIDVTAYSRRELGEIAAAPRTARPGRAGAAEGRHRPVPRRLPHGRLAGAGRRGPPARGRGPPPGHRRVVALRLQRRARPPRQRRPAARRSSEALAQAAAAGLEPEVRHLANSASAVLRPSSRYDLVRCRHRSATGSTRHPALLPDLGLVPAMTVRAPLAHGQAVPAGAGVSYGHTWVADRPDHASAWCRSGTPTACPATPAHAPRCGSPGARRPVRGRICMDQFVVDLEGDLPDPGDPVVLFGPGTAASRRPRTGRSPCDTINYEIVTRIGGRLHRRVRRRRPTDERGAHR